MRDFSAVLVGNEVIDEFLVFFLGDGGSAGRYFSLCCEKIVVG